MEVQNQRMGDVTEDKEREIIPERLECCPVCQEKGIISSVERLQWEVDRYWVFCTRKNGCSFSEEYFGKMVVAKKDIMIYGLPGELTEHMDIFYEDIFKIVRLCLSEFLKFNYEAAPSIDFDLNTMKELIRIFAKSHGLKGFDKLTNTYDCGSKADDNFGETTIDPCNLGSNKPTQSTQKNEDLAFLFQNLNSQFLLPKKVKHGEFTLSENQEQCHQSAKCYDPYESMRQLAESLVADLPVPYQDKVKTAFSKIKGYNFPQDFGDAIASDKLPLFKILEEAEKEEQIEAEEDEQLKSLLNEIDDLKELLL